MPEIPGLELTIKSFISNDPANGALAAIDGAGARVSLIAWSPVTGDTTYSAPAGTGANTRIHRFDRPIVSTSTIEGTTITGTIATAAQPNVTSIGTLSSLFVSGTATVAQLNPFALGTFKILGGSVATALRNNADSADNLHVSDAGVVTARAGLTVTSGTSAFQAVTATTISATSPITSANGSPTAPAIQLGTDGGVQGFYRAGSAQVGIVGNVVIVDNTAGGIGDRARIDFYANDTGGNPENFGRVGVYVSNATGGVEAGHVYISTLSAGVLAKRWNVLSTGHFVAETDNAYDIGQSGANRPRNAYIAGMLVVGGASTLSGTVGFGSGWYLDTGGYQTSTTQDGTGFALTHNSAIRNMSFGVNGSRTQLVLLASGNVQTSGTFLAPSLALGTTPAASGVIRLPNDGRITARNTTNTTDYDLIFLTTSNEVTVGTSLRATNMIGSFVFFNSIGTTASGANAFLDGASANNLLRSTSSARYKDIVGPMMIEDARGFLMSLDPLWYRSLASADDPEDVWPGFTAERVAKVDDAFAHYDRKGRPDSIMYDRIVVPLTVGFQDHEQRIAKLEERLSRLEN
jgi:hypothetical protein